MASIYQPNYIVQVYCDACGSVHTINFRNRSDFDRVRCPFEGVPVFRTPAAFNKVYREIKNEVRKVA